MASKFPDNPIAQVRLAARKTGEEFAASLNLSVGAVRNMERGVLAPGEETRERMFITYGVDTDSVATVKGTALYARGLVPYTWETYLDWKKLTTVDDAKAKEMIELEIQRVRWFLQAAAMNGSLFTTKFLLETALEDMAKQGGLVGLIETIMRQKGSEDHWFRMDIGTIGVVEHVLKQLERDSSAKSDAPTTSEGS